MPQPAVGAFFHTPGPKEVYVMFRGTGTWQFVGTCVQAPEHEDVPNAIEVFNDYGGRSVPTQLVWDGQTALVTCVLNRLDLAVVRNLRDAASRIGTAASVGSESNLERGTLMIGVSDFDLVVKNVYFGTTNATPGMAPGRRYFSAIVGAYKESTVGTRVEEAAIVFKCHNVMLPDKSFKLYSEDPNDVPTANLVNT